MYIVYHVYFILYTMGLTVVKLGSEKHIKVVKEVFTIEYDKFFDLIVLGSLRVLKVSKTESNDDAIKNPAENSKCEKVSSVEKTSIEERSLENGQQSQRSFMYIF